MDDPYFINLQKFQNLDESLNRIRIAAESASEACRFSRQCYIDEKRAMPDARHCEEIVDRLLFETRNLIMLMSMVRSVAMNADLKFQEKKEENS